MSMALLVISFLLLFLKCFCGMEINFVVQGKWRVGFSFAVQE